MIFIRIINLILFTILIFQICIETSISANYDWELVKNQEGIKVYTRNIPDSKIKEFRGVTTIDTSLDSLIGVMYHTDSYSKWVYNTKDPVLLKRVSFTERYHYQVINFPFPVGDRDVIFHSLLSQDPRTKEITIELNAVPEYVPDSRLVRIIESDGFYHFEPLSDGTVEVIWQHHTDPGGGVPKWLVNMLIVDTPFKTLRNLKKIVQKEMYQRARLKYSSEGIAVDFITKDWLFKIRE